MKHIRTKFLAVISTVALVSGVISPCSVFAGTYENDGSGNMEVTATVESSYKVELPAILDLNPEIFTYTNEYLERQIENEDMLFYMWLKNSSYDVNAYYATMNDSEKAEVHASFIAQYLGETVVMVKKKCPIRVSDVNIPHSKWIRMSLGEQSTDVTITTDIWGDNFDVKFPTIRGVTSGHTIPIKNYQFNWDTCGILQTVEDNGDDLVELYDWTEGSDPNATDEEFVRDQKSIVIANYAGPVEATDFGFDGSTGELHVQTNSDGFRPLPQWCRYPEAFAGKLAANQYFHMGSFYGTSDEKQGIPDNTFAGEFGDKVDAQISYWIDITEDADTVPADTYEGTLLFQWETEDNEVWNAFHP